MAVNPEAWGKSAVVGLALLLAGCSSSKTPVGVGPSPIAAAQAEEDAAEQRVEDIFLTDGNTQQTELPSGDVTYTGLVHGFDGGGTGPDMEYFADLTLEVDFDNDAIGGNVDNFRTDMTGFASPSGNAPVIGTVSAGVGDATLDFTADGTLNGASRSADYQLFADGNFVGDNAEAARCTHETDFDWLTGPDTGDTSFSDGHWTVEQ